MYAQSPFASERTELFVRLYSVQKFIALNPALGKWPDEGNKLILKMHKSVSQ